MPKTGLNGINTVYLTLILKCIGIVVLSEIKS